MDRTARGLAAARLLAALAAAGLLAGLGHGCVEEPESGPVRIAVSFPGSSPVGAQLLQGARLALDEVGNRAAGRRVEILPLDTTSAGVAESVEGERESAERAAGAPSVVIYLGPMTSDQARVSIPILNRAGLAQVSATATWPGLTKPGFAAGEPAIHYPSGRRTFFRLTPADDVRIASAVAWIERLGARRVWVVDDGRGFSRGLAGMFGVAAEDRGLEILGRESLAPVNPAKAELAAAAARAVAAAPDLVYVPSGRSPFLRQLLALEPDFPVMVTTDRLDLLEELDPGLAQGLFALVRETPVFWIGTPRTEAFRAAYREAFGDEAGNPALASYEAMLLVLTALERAAEPTREGVLSALEALGSFETVRGTRFFDEQGDVPPLGGAMFQVRSGAWLLVEERPENGGSSAGAAQNGQS